MALTQASLSGKIKTEIEAVYGAPADSQRLQDFCDALATAIVDEIINNAEVIIGAGSSAGTYGVS